MNGPVMMGKRKTEMPSFVMVQIATDGDIGIVAKVYIWANVK